MTKAKRLRFTLRKNAKWQSFEAADPQLLSFCEGNLPRYVTLPVGTESFDAVVSNRKPRHQEYFTIEWNRAHWWFGLTDITDRGLDETPWPGMFDRYLRDHFGTDQTLYGWVEL